MSTTQTTIFPALTRAMAAVENQRRLCRHAADALDAAGLYVIAHAFRFTAAQEQEHAAILTALLPDAPPLPEDHRPLPEQPAQWLRAAIGSEASCYSTLLPEAARAAAEAGQPRVAAALLRLADTDRRHEQRFRQYLTALENGSLLRSDSPTSWFCLSCSGLHHGCEAPARCDSCGAGRGHFIRSNFHPFAVTER